MGRGVMEPRLKSVGIAPSDPMEVKRWARRGAQASLSTRQKVKGMLSGPGEEVGVAEESATRTSWVEIVAEPASAARPVGMGESSPEAMAAWREEMMAAWEVGLVAGVQLIEAKKWLMVEAMAGGSVMMGREGWGWRAGKEVGGGGV